MKLRTKFICWIFILIGILCAGCRTDAISTQESIPLNTDSPSPTLFSTKTATTEAIIQATFVKPEPTSSPIPEPTQIENPTFNKLLLVYIYEDVANQTGGEVWVLDAGKNAPRPLLNDELLSYTSPTWSRSGEYIAYEQHLRSLPDETQVGIADTEGKIQHLFSGTEFKNVGRLGWSADDRWITFVSLSSEHGIVPFAIEIGTEEIKNLHPNPDIRYSRAIMKPSPRSNIAVYVGFYENPDLRADIWILSLDDNQVARYIEFDMPSECGRFTDIEWAPDGESFLVQPDTVSNQYECWPRAFSYDITDQTWSEVVRAPEENRRFAYLYWLHWSPDGHWLAWVSSSIEDVLVYDTNTWEVVGSFNLGSSQRFFGSPWVQDSADRSILSIVETKYTSDFSAMFIVYGIDPRKITDNKQLLIAEIAPETEWLPTEMRSRPLWWQP